MRWDRGVSRGEAGWLGEGGREEGGLKVGRGFGGLLWPLVSVWIRVWVSGFE